MKVSIITTTYNSALTVRDTLNSVQRQNYPDIEHIVIDGNSGDGTMNIVKEFPHVSKCISEPDKGMYDAMNKGISIASGDVIGILNSDDTYTGPGIIAEIAGVFSDPLAKTCYADLQYVQANNPDKVVRTWKAGFFTKKNFYFGWMPPHPTFFVRKEVYEKVGLFNLCLKSAADYEMMLRILIKHEIPTHYIPRVIVKMRAGGLSNASFKNRINANKEDRLAWKLNGLQPHFFTLYAKPIRKISQFLIK
ncbi:MAG: glycosyltransferase [Bacteroidetes bacterium]|nr:glycosyltransferase [Bacteroidota bacterium]MBS1973890.1 glycosyltransferase [Bacteroidota bacterium]